MGRNRKRKYKYSQKDEPEDPSKIPIPNLPEKYLSLNVKSGSKIRNILEYAFKEFENYDSVLWTAANMGIKKAISCAEIFKRKHPDLHQVTKLRYIKSKNDDPKENSDENGKTRRVPEIHIFLSKESIIPQSEFTTKMKNLTPIRNEESPENDSTKITCETTEEFAEMNLKTGQKRPSEASQIGTPFKKRNKKKGKH